MRYYRHTDELAQIANLFVLAYGHQYRVFNGKWWRLDDRGYWSDDRARDRAILDMLSVAEEAGDWARDHAGMRYWTNRIMASIGYLIQSFPGLPGRAIRPEDQDEECQPS